MTLADRLEFWILSAAGLGLMVGVALLPGTFEQRVARVIGLVLTGFLAALALGMRDAKEDVALYVVALAAVVVNFYGWSGVASWWMGRRREVWRAESRDLRIDSCLLDAQSVRFVEAMHEMPKTTGRIAILRGSWRTLPRGGLRTIPVSGWPEYEVRASSEDLAAAVMGSGVRDFLLRLDQLGGDAFLCVLRPGVLQVRATFAQASERQLATFARRARELAARFHGVLMTRVLEVIAVESSAGVCAICGVGIGDVAATCVKCGTPHHRECWTYNGRCSIYACGEARWT